ncbi:hypothetical protein NDN08_004114 [Rhodosorus marinus]|uniref:MMS19 nucleotide excision repair protein n=1 Tax=Rhodosorus marinus TaxID=101924 RepID=A0AAV8UHC0_9RHOD|nr:hypothetical protein NDN08_004114 [Rhodosorus marinus]
MDHCKLKHPNEEAVTLEGPAGVFCVTCSRNMLTDEYALSSIKVGTATKLKLGISRNAEKLRGFLEGNPEALRRLFCSLTTAQIQAAGNLDQELSTLTTDIQVWLAFSSTGSWVAECCQLLLVSLRDIGVDATGFAQILLVLVSIVDEAENLTVDLSEILSLIASEVGAPLRDAMSKRLARKSSELVSRCFILLSKVFDKLAQAEKDQVILVLCELIKPSCPDHIRIDVLSALLEGLQRQSLVPSKHHTELLESFKLSLMAEDRTVRNLTCASLEVLVLLDEYALKTLECGLIDYLYEVIRQSGELKDGRDSDCLSWLLNILYSLAHHLPFKTTLAYGMRILLQQMSQVGAVHAGPLLRLLDQCLSFPASETFEDRDAKFYLESLRRISDEHSIVVDCAGLSGLVEWFRLSPELIENVVHVVADSAAHAKEFPSFLHPMHTMRLILSKQLQEAERMDERLRSKLLSCTLESLLPVSACVTYPQDLSSAGDVWIEVFGLAALAMDPDIHDDEASLHRTGVHCQRTISLTKVFEVLERNSKNLSLVGTGREFLRSVAVAVHPLSKGIKLLNSEIPGTKLELITGVECGSAECCLVFLLSEYESGQDFPDVEDVFCRVAKCLSVRSVSTARERFWQLRVLCLCQQKMRCTADTLASGGDRLPRALFLDMLSYVPTSDDVNPEVDTGVLSWFLAQVEKLEELYVIVNLFCRHKFSQISRRTLLLDSLCSRTAADLGLVEGLLKTVANNKPSEIVPVALEMATRSVDFSAAVLKVDVNVTFLSTERFVNFYLRAWLRSGVEDLDEFPPRQALGFLLGTMQRDGVHEGGVKFLREFCRQANIPGKVSPGTSASIKFLRTHEFILSLIRQVRTDAQQNHYPRLGPHEMTGNIQAEVLRLFSHIPELDRELFSSPAEWADRIMIEFERGQYTTLEAVLELMSASTSFHSEFNPTSRMLVLMVANLCASDNFRLSAAAKFAMDRLTSYWPEANLLTSCTTAARFYIPYETSTISE